jgi:urate oxidase/2-oxo-4-hydroxy-4-carboxy-5-ureidoimidazoline decarboxylase
VEQFASGFKRHYYGKSDVIAYRLRRTKGASDGQGVFGASVTLLVYGDAFWPTYTTGDNTGLVATDSMKNFIQRETLTFEGQGLDDYVHYLGAKFLATYPRVEGLKLSAVELPYEVMPRGVGYVPAGPERATATIEMTSTKIAEIVSGLRGFRLLRTSGSAFHGFVRDQYTTLPDLFDRPLHMWLDMEWRYVDFEGAARAHEVVERARAIVHDVFEGFASGSIQQLIYAIGTGILQNIREIAEVDLEAQNRTWDTVAEHADAGVYTDPRPPFGLLGLRLKR